MLTKQNLSIALLSLALVAAQSQQPAQAQKGDSDAGTPVKSTKIESTSKSGVSGEFTPLKTAPKTDGAGGSKDASKANPPTIDKKDASSSLETGSAGVGPGSEKTESPPGENASSEVSKSGPEATDATSGASTKLESASAKLIYSTESGSGVDFRQTADQLRNEAISHFEAAQYYMSKWDSEMAEVELRAAIMYMPNMKVAHRDYCLVALLRGKPLRALAEFMMVVGLGDPIPLDINQRVELQEQASGLHYNKGLDLAKDGKWSEAISELAWSILYTPRDPAVHRSLAFMYASSGDYRKAEEHYSTTLELAPEDAHARADFAFLLSEKGQGDKAVEQMKEAVRLQPDATALHVDLGWLAEAKGDLKTARSEFSKAVALSPDHPALWSHLGKIFKKLGQTDDAKTAFQKALKLDPTDVETKGLLAELK